jgi:hypothetical protein
MEGLTQKAGKSGGSVQALKQGAAGRFSSNYELL